MDFETISEEQLASNEALVGAYLSEVGLDASEGTALNETAVKPPALLFTVTDTAFQTTLDNLDINTAADVYATRLLSNYNLVPQSAGQGTGFILLLTKSTEDLIIRNTVTFISGGYNIFLNRDYIGTLNYAASLPSIYVPLRKYNDEYYYILVQGTTQGDMTTPLLPGTALTPSQSVTNLDSAEIAATFATVRQSKTLADLKDEVANGVSAKILAGPAHIKAMLEESDQLSVIDTSVVGMNDIEMLRDSKNIYGTSSGGYVDIYAKTLEYASSKEVLKTAVAVSPGRYKIMINKDDAPGFYYINSVSYNAITKTTDLGMFSYTFGVDISDAIFVPTFPDDKDGRYSEFQNCAVEFNYAGVAADDTAPEFLVELIYMPNIAAVQAFVSDPDTRTPSADYVVKAAVPLFLSIDLVVSYNSADTRPSETDIAEAVSTAVNSIPMGQRFLSGADIACAVTKLYPNTTVKLPVVLEAFMIDNEGVFRRERSINTLEIPSFPEQGITEKTATFMVNPSDVGVRLIGDKK